MFLHPSRRKGFTLVEIMIVVAIIALLAAVAIPSFLRSRKRSQATSVLNEARVLDTALTCYVVENGKHTGQTVGNQDFYPYLVSGSRLYMLSRANNQITDLFENNYVFNGVDNGIKVSPITTQIFSDIIEDPTLFWGSFR